MKKRKRRRAGFFHEHSLSLVTLGFLTTWLVFYRLVDSKSHLGFFLGNAIADWGCLLVIILGTKYLSEIHSAEGKSIKGRLRNPLLNFMRQHSLLLFITVTGIGWTLLYLKMDASGKWGEVVGNIVSDWLELAGLVFFTKRLTEKNSKESR